MAVSTLDPVSTDDEGSRAIQQEERQRLAQVLHDSFSQSLTAAYLQALVLAQKMDREGAGPVADVGRLANMLHDMVEELRGITRQLSSEAENSSAPASPHTKVAGAEPVA